jgi:hypothetical protein
MWWPVTFNEAWTSVLYELFIFILKITRIHLSFHILASATREQLGVLRYPTSTPRPSIIGRDDFFVRYGDKEREAVASFDFLEDISTTSVSGASSCDTLGSCQKLPVAPQQLTSKAQTQQQPPKKQPSQSELEMTTPSSEDSDDRTGGQLSFSDSCAASFSGSSVSLENQEE